MAASTRLFIIMVLINISFVLSFRMKRQIYNQGPGGVGVGGTGGIGGPYGGYRHCYGLGPGYQGMGYGYGWGGYLYGHYGGGYDNNYGGTNIGSINTENVNA